VKSLADIDREQLTDQDGILPMKILIYGEAVRHGVALPLKTAFERLGHTARIFDWPRYLFTARRYSLINRALDRLLFSHIARKINKDLIAAVTDGGYDLVIVIRGNHVFPETVGEAKRFTRFVVNWNSDDFFNSLNSSAHIVKSFDKYDCIFTSRGHLREEYLGKGAKQFEVLNWYYRPDMMESVDPGQQRSYSRDIAFIGSWSRRREDILSSLRDFDLAVYGGSWQKANRSFRAKIPCNGPVYSEKMVEVMMSSRINLNILTLENRDTTNIRNYEIPSCGAFQLSERSDAILDIFEEGKEIECWGDIYELGAKCSYYLEHDSEREGIAASGYERLITCSNDITDRATRILEALFGKKK
jgi:spore maturation protein CgeB